VSVMAATLANFDLDNWNAQVYGAMALASRISSLVKNRAETVKLSRSLKRLDSSLSKLFEEIYKGLERSELSKIRGVTPELVTSASEVLFQLNRILATVYEACKQARLTNNSLTAGTLRSINERNEEILELADLLKLSLEPDVIESIHARARKEKKRGDVFDLSQV
jgi:hypothetical protein